MVKKSSWLSLASVSLCLTGLLGCFKAPPPSGDGSARGMVEVAAGKFLRGSNDGENHEKPSREIHLDAFWMDVYEVTVDEYAKCVREGGCSEPKESHSDDSTYNWKGSGRGKHPINGVSWNQAVAYCKWAGKRLPTEAEWEKAARGTAGRKYPWGNEGADCSRAVMSEDGGGNDCGRDGTWEVGRKPSGVSSYGVHDMAGNVLEWTADWYGQDYYASAPGRNPMGPDGGSNRVIRGGSWFSYAANLRVARRDFYPPSRGSDTIGFRCARSN